MKCFGHSTLSITRLRNNSFYATYVNGRLEMDLLRVTWNKANNKKKLPRPRIKCKLFHSFPSELDSTNYIVKAPLHLYWTTATTIYTKNNSLQSLNPNSTKQLFFCGEIRINRIIFCKLQLTFRLVIIFWVPLLGCSKYSARYWLPLRSSAIDPFWDPLPKQLCGLSQTCVNRILSDVCPRKTNIICKKGACAIWVLLFMWKLVSSFEWK